MLGLGGASTGTVDMLPAYKTCHTRGKVFVSPCPVSNLSDIADLAAIEGDVEIPHVVAVQQQTPRRGVVEAEE